MEEMQYLQLLQDVMENGDDRPDRTKVGTRSVFVRTMRFNLKKGFPLFTTKKISLKNIAAELISFIRGDNTLRFLLERNCNIWNEWCFEKWVQSEDFDGPIDMTDFALRAEKDPEFAAHYKAEMKRFKELILTDDTFSEKYGNLGRIYGKQWREWIGEEGEVIDQLSDLIEMIKKDPYSRRKCMTAWQPSVAKFRKAALPACHTFFQLYVSEGRLSGMFYARSNDLFLGCPYNIPSYALLIHLIARECGLEVDELVYVGGEVHIYQNHFEQVQEQLQREPREAPVLVLDENTTIWDIDVEHISVENYNPHPAIPAPVAV